MSMTFVDELPGEEPSRRSGPKTEYLDELRANPGYWGEIARYPQEKRNAAYSRGRGMARRYEQLEFAVRLVGDECVLFMRWVAQ
jgi:hypothetical protein